MAELLRKIIDEHTLYAIWKISETVSELESSITLREGEKELYRSFVAESRKKQWLSYRILIRALLLPDDFPVEYDPSGKPFLAGSDYHISVTHSDDLAAVIMSRTSRVGIDLEKMKSRIEKVKDKFIHPAESEAFGADMGLEHLTLTWCAKEALYKIYGHRELDFRDHIRVEIPTSAGVRFKAEIGYKGKFSQYWLYSEKFGDFILVYLLDPSI
jgi:phosphopantetheinyl transferase